MFLPNASTSTYGFGNSVVPGSGRNFYISNGITTVLNDYEFVQPQYDICQGDAFSPGGGNDFLGFITLSAGETASLNVSNGGGPPEAKVVISGQGFAPGETVDIYSDRIGGVLLTSGPAGQASGFALSTRLPQRPYGSMELIAIGQTTGNIGLASLSIKAGMAADPNYGMPGETTTADALGFAAAESVAIYWNSPRQLLPINWAAPQ